MSENGKPDCYKCEHRGTLPGSEHSKCTHPLVADLVRDPLFNLAATLASVGRVAPVQVGADKLNIRANYHGIKRGWFNWPMNFDPTWLEQCEGFTPKETV
ncbi:hypothetical protein LCGC14_1800660 [marine sediment metagenome]|uniref:Uncharacterized protein n=1 Tax=marine sediment metagenome TaxID=412755 RepID=A0A0F9JPE3_9ZZZZ